MKLILFVALFLGSCQNKYEALTPDGNVKHRTTKLKEFPFVIKQSYDKVKNKTLYTIGPITEKEDGIPIVNYSETLVERIDSLLFLDGVFYGYGKNLFKNDSTGKMQFKRVFFEVRETFKITRERDSIPILKTEIFEPNIHETFEMFFRTFN
jgi:hypothetical protein